MSDRIAELRTLLQLAPHPEGGWYRELHRSAQNVEPLDGRGPRAGLTLIDFLLTQGEFSAWHVVTSDETWHYAEGDPLLLFLFDPRTRTESAIELGPVTAERRNVAVVPAGVWQAARSTGDYTLVQCCVGPGFDFQDFRLIRDSAKDAALATQLSEPARRFL